MHYRVRCECRTPYVAGCVADLNQREVLGAGVLVSLGGFTFKTYILLLPLEIGIFLKKRMVLNFLQLIFKSVN